MESGMARVVVVGTSGVGKTIFARQLAQLLRAPHVELDALYWLPNWAWLPSWRRRPIDELRTLVTEAVSQERWVADGDYGAVHDLVWSRATAVIWLNYTLPTVFGRVLRRTLRRPLTGDSILWWIITTLHRRRGRQPYRALFDQPVTVSGAYIEFRRPCEAERFLVALAADMGE